MAVSSNNNSSFSTTQSGSNLSPPDSPRREEGGALAPDRLAYRRYVEEATAAGVQPHSTFEAWLL
eukprot:CAMPEP_0113725244 /NCGR_PEP_ID=MMETSP0038_2-20120614/39615_1 /TAXON_ID=2898 /ORGANISM="Cryptomonas paramecium" /LENGTH=64 /DNA_ID=CAMNT_0000655411 /DNA_START=139 /DNA_END=330 /DNA_ORIENTATION=- /assembly_acc=CAM_ASM_000170